MNTLRSIARALGGEIAGIDQVLCPAPGHSWRDRGLSVRLDPKAPGGFLVHLFNGDEQQALAAKDYVRERLGLGRPSICPAPRGSRTDGQGDPGRTARALTLWQEARDPRETPVEAYLALRGLEFPCEIPGEVIRFHPSCPFAGQRVPAMVALVRDVVTNEPKAIHRTALSRDGRKIEVNGKDRLALGPVACGAVKLTSDEDVTTCLGIGEGIESTLSLRHAPEFGASPLWSLLSAGGIERFPGLAGIECLWIAVDHDPAGLKAAQACARRWQAAGRDVFLVVPSAPREDLNDLVEGPHA